MKRSFRILTAFALVPLLMGGAGCGGGSSTPSAAEDKAQAERIVLKASDLPGFTVDPDSDEDDGIDGIRACVNDNPTWNVRPNPRGADSAFTNPDDVVVASGALLTAKEPEARKAFADVKEALSGQCLGDELKATILDDAPSGLTVGNVSNTQLPSPNVGDESTASRLTLEIAAGNEREKLYIDFSFFREGRIVAGLFSFQAGQPFPDAERARLTTLISNRMSGKDDGKAAAPVASVVTTAAPTSPQTTTGAATVSGWTRYQDPSGVSFEHPPTWTVDHLNAIIVLFIDPPGLGPFRRNMNILVQALDQATTLDAYTQLSLRQLQENRATTLGRAEPTTLSGSPAHRVVHNSTEGGGRQFLSVWTLRGRNAWVVTYTSDAGAGRFDEKLPDVERVLGTIRLPA